MSRQFPWYTIKPMDPDNPEQTLHKLTFQGKYGSFLAVEITATRYDLESLRADLEWYLIDQPAEGVSG